ncbi:hypothetical protein L6164_011342 [Bauhinia variegata]|uniref:Uncharacterized protein n=1 Tax=Bauhinia variegata TaxID=167791 RepID=A0ACB9P5U5_BAUVA|nr:hypothetical protein L6164_011342 [Bauhinia variegata]
MDIGQDFRRASSVSASSIDTYKQDEEEALKWAALERLPTYERAHKGLLHGVAGDFREIDLKKLDFQEKKDLLDRVVKDIDENEKFLRRLKKRIDRVSLNLPTVEVRFQNIKVDGEAYVGKRALPTVVNFYLNLAETVGNYLHIIPSKKKKFSILGGISGIIKPGRMTLLLGPPGSGKSTLLQALSGKLHPELKFSGKVTYNGHEMKEFEVPRTSAYISQYDVHLPLLTVRETLTFSARCQGVGTGYDLLVELLRREKQLNITPDPYIDALMKASVLSGQKEDIVTAYMIKILGLEVCADTIVGNELMRGVSGGQKKRVTTGEMLVGPVNGPRENVLQFFEFMGFTCPERKGIADYLQEVTSVKDQRQYWSNNLRPYRYISVQEFAEAFKSFHLGTAMQRELATPFERSKSHPAALSRAKYGASRKELMKACLAREVTLMKRSAPVHIFKTVQSEICALMVAAVFSEARKHHATVDDGAVYLGALFFMQNCLTFSGFFELPMTIGKLPVFYKQRDHLFYPSWAFSLPASFISIPVSIVEVFLWVATTYYVIGFDPDFTRMLRFYLILALNGQMSYSLFRLIAAVSRDHVVANTVACITVLWLLILSGFILSKETTPKWLIWGYWTNPIMYTENAISVNEFLGKTWNRVVNGSNETLGVAVLKFRGVEANPNMYWIAVIALIGFLILFNVVCALALAFFQEYGKSQSVVIQEETSKEKHNIRTGEPEDNELENESSTRNTNMILRKSTPTGRKRGKGLILPFTPLCLTFENITYSVDMPKGMKSQGVLEERLVLLKEVSGAFRPGVLTALMGVSGAGKTTLLDVLAGRKNSGYIEGNITVSGYPKNQATFARVSGYCEQNDIHTALVTVYESLIYSAWLRLPPEVEPKTRELFVEEVMELIELTPLRDALVGYPNVNGLSTEQRKRAAFVPLIEYFERIKEVEKIREGYNPATWALEMTTRAQEDILGVKFADIYKNSDLFRRNEALIRELSTPPPGSQDLHFSTRYSQSYLNQFKACVWKQHKSYWRNTAYNAVRLLFGTALAIIFGFLFWRQGSHRDSKVEIFNALGSMYMSVMFIGSQSAGSVRPVIISERTVYYRERAAGMYSSVPYSLAQVAIEIPYSATQIGIYGVIVYAMMGYQWIASKFLLYMFFMLSTVLYFIYYGMMVLAVSPNQESAAILNGVFYTAWNLFAGFVIPRERVASWLRWYQWLSPTGWSIYGMAASQYADDQTRLDSGETVQEFMRDYFGFRHDFLWIVALALIGFNLLFVSVYTYAMKAFNFQRR